MSDEITLLMERALFAHRRRGFADAETLYLQILDREPTFPQAHLMLGILYAESDRPLEAAPHLSVAAEGAPSFLGLSWLARTFGVLGRNTDAVEVARRALELQPNDVPTLLNLAAAQFALGEFEEAAQAFGRVAALEPRNVPARQGLATCFVRLGQPLEARRALNEAAGLSPDPDTLLKLGEVCIACDKPEEALQIVELLQKNDPQNVEVSMLKALANRAVGNEGAEDAALAAVLERDPENARAHTMRGNRLQTLGRFGEAEGAFRTSITLQPAQGFAYYGIASSRKMVAGDESLLDAMEALVREGKLIDDEVAHLEFALGKAYDDLGEYGDAMRHYDAGNKLKSNQRRGQRKFDPGYMKRRIDDVINTFTGERLNGPLSASAAVRPVVVGGIMRSGTTLLEQMLSRHPEIGAAGEQIFWRTAEPDCVDYAKDHLDAKRLAEAGSGYIRLLSRLAPNHRFVTEKNPENRLFYGLIRLGVSNAQILHMQRNPLDVAISIYTTPMRNPAAFMGDKGDIAFTLKMHKRLTEHWVEALPSSVFRIVKYEDLVSAAEPEIRSVIDFLGLTWSDACLSPQDNRRTVLTPSMWQVRQPIYASSVERWRRYEPWLGPLAELIE